MQRLGQQRPEVPVVVDTAHPRARIALDGMVQIGKPHRIAQEKDRRVVAHQIPVARIGVEFHREAAYVAFGIGGTAFPRNGRKTDETLGLLADPAENRGPGVARDVVRHGKGAVGAGAFGVHTPFGNHLAVEMRELFEHPGVLQHDGATQSGSLRILVVGDRPAVDRSQLFGFPLSFSARSGTFFFLHKSNVFGLRRPSRKTCR